MKSKRKPISIDKDLHTKIKIISAEQSIHMYKLIDSIVEYVLNNKELLKKIIEDIKKHEIES